MRATQRAFTLIELLIVVAIITLLVSILLPTIGQIDRLMKNTRCQRNLREIGKLLHAYTDAYEGWYPYPICATYGTAFRAYYVTDDPWPFFPHFLQLRQMGAKREMFFCPFDETYGDWDAYPACSWDAPRVYQRSGYKDSAIYIGYSLLTYRGWIDKDVAWTWSRNVLFADGRYPIGMRDNDDDIPIAADNMRYRTSSGSSSGWYHGGGTPEGLFNADCNTLYNSGAVACTRAEEFDWSKPSIIRGTDLWWCALPSKPAN